MSRQSHSSRFYHPRNSGWGLKIMELLIRFIFYPTLIHHQSLHRGTKGTQEITKSCSIRYRLMEREVIKCGDSYLVRNLKSCSFILAKIQCKTKGNEMRTKRNLRARETVPSENVEVDVKIILNWIL
jgi:hypothetical protein